MSLYKISGETTGSIKIRLFTESDNEYIGFSDVNEGSYEIKFRLNSQEDVFAAGELASGEARSYGKITPLTASGIPTITQPERWIEKSGVYTAENGDRLLLDSSVSGFSVNLPNTPQIGDHLSFVDAAGSCETNNVIIDRNGNKIMGLDEDMTINRDNASFDLVYYNSTYGWRIKCE